MLTMQTGRRGLDVLSPLQIEDELTRIARDEAERKAASHEFLDAELRNPSWAAATPRAAFFRLGEFALAESKRVWNEPDLGGMPRRAGIADRFHAFLAGVGTGPGISLLLGGLEYATTTLGFDADAFVHELAYSVIGDDYPEPDRMLPHTEKVVRHFLEKTMFDNRPPPTELDLFAAESGTAAICYVFDSLLRAVALNRTARLSLPQQAQMTLLSLFALLDRDDVSPARALSARRSRAPAPRAPATAAASLPSS